MTQGLEFGAALGAQLQRLGWSQRRFATTVNRSQAFVARVVSGERRPPLDVLAAWIDVLAPSSADAEELVRLAIAAHGASGLIRHLERSRSQSRAAEPPDRYGK